MCCCCAGSTWGIPGHEVLEAQDGEHGIADAVAERPDAIVLDLMLPRIDGYEVLRTLREDERTSADLPVLVLSAKAQSEDRRRCLEMGADEFLTKPFSPEALCEALQRLTAMDVEARTAGRTEALGQIED